MRALVLALAVVLLPAATPAQAALTTAYGQWDPLTGASNDYTTAMRLSPRFPAATVTSDSRSGQVGVQQGTSVWLPAWTPVGERYGSSQGQPYLNLRPRADTATTPSETTYAFERPTPQGWAFVLGDVDADAVRVSATGATGAALTSAQLGFRGTFNFCAQTPRPSGCSGAQTDVPTWDPVTATLTGNAGALDTTGASGWFEPTVPVSALTVEFTRRAGFPVYQTWFALRMQDVSGTVSVSAGTCDVTAVSVNLLGVLGNVIDTATPDATGAWSFTGLAASDGYRVALGDLPAGCRVDGPSSRPFDLSTGDATVPFQLREVVPAAVEGAVVDQDGLPVAGVTVVVTPAGGGAPVTTTTDVDGRWVVDGNAPGDYTVSVQPPLGYARTSPDQPVTVPVGDDAPITLDDFTLAANPTVSGTVRAGPDGVGGAVVELRDGSGAVVASTVTAGDGTYAFPRIPAATYAVVVIEVPGGYALPPPRTADATGGDSPGIDFQLTRDGAVGGQVVDQRGPRSGVEVVVSGPGGFTRTLTTDGDGRYLVEDLPPGTYTVTLTPPDGTTAAVTRRTVTITAAGDTFGAEDFILVAGQTPTTSPPTTAPTTTSPASTSSSSTSATTVGAGGSAGKGGPLARTGSGIAGTAQAGALLLALGSVLLASSRRRPSGRYR